MRIAAILLVFAVMGCESHPMPNNDNAKSPYDTKEMLELCERNPNSVWCDCVLRRDETEDCL